MSRPPALWNPPAPPGAENPFDQIVPAETDLYLVVDEIEGTQVRLVVSAWPTVDGDDHLIFPEIRSRRRKTLDDPSDAEMIVDLDYLHGLVTEGRSGHHQLADDRPIRVGDTFWFRGVGGPELDGDLVDVTFAARGEAKAAMAWAVSGTTGTPADLLTAPAELAEDEARPDLEAIESADQGPARPSVPGSVASPSI